MRRYARGGTSPEGFWLDSYDYARLKAEVLEPLAPGGSRRFRTRGHDLESVDRSYVEAQRRYLAERTPWERADLVVDNTDPAAPRLLNAALD